LDFSISYLFTKLRREIKLRLSILSTGALENASIFSKEMTDCGSALAMLARLQSEMKNSKAHVLGIFDLI
jgi:hypothetical protein